MKVVKRKMRAYFMTLLLTVFIVASVRCLNHLELVQYEGIELFDYLTHPSRYDEQTLPPSIGPLSLKTRLVVSALGNFKAGLTEFSSQLEVRYEWRDPRLAYRELAPQVKHLVAEEWGHDLIWVPTIFMANDKKSTVITFPRQNIYIVVSPDGDVVYRFRLNLRMHCALNVRRFPFDRTQCRLPMQSWSLPEEELKLEWDEDGHNGTKVEISNEFSMLEYRLIDVKTSSDVAEMEYGNFSRVVVTFEMERESNHFILDYYIPAAICVMISWVAFWLDPTVIPGVSGRTALGLITIRTLIYVTHNISASVPKVSTINAISVYSIICITFIVCSLSQLGYVSRILHGGTKTIELKRLDTREVLKATIQRPLSSPVLGNLKSPSLTQNELVVSTAPGIGNVPVTTKLKKDKSPREVANWVDRRCRIVFPIMFSLLNILYWALVWV